MKEGRGRILKDGGIGMGQLGCGGADGGIIGLGYGRKVLAT